MKKFNLIRTTALSLAGVAIMTIGGCANKESQEVSYTVVGVQSVDNTVSDTVEEATSKKEFGYEEEAPIAVPIEKVTMEDGSIGYKVPFGYRAYLVDETYSMPALLPVLEETDEYTTYSGLEGAVAVYSPYFYLLRMHEDPVAFDFWMRDAKEILGEESLAYQMYTSVASGEISEIVSSVYYENVDYMQR